MNISLYYSSKSGKRQHTGPQEPRVPFLTSMPYVTAAPKKGTSDFDSTYINHVNQGLQRRLSKVKLDYEREKSWVDEQLKRINQFKNCEIKYAADMSIVSGRSKFGSRKTSSLDSALSEKTKKATISSPLQRKQSKDTTVEQGLWKVPFTILNEQKEQQQDIVQAPSIHLRREQTPYKPISKNTNYIRESDLLNGSFDERESSQSFQDALNAWRQSKPIQTAVAPSQFVSNGTYTASSSATTDAEEESYFKKLSPVKSEAVKVQFSGNDNISYFDRLLLSQKPKIEF